MNREQEWSLVAELREIRQEVRDVHARIDRHAARNDRNFAEVKDKQDLTNGSVKELQGWRLYIEGALATGTAVTKRLLLPVFTGVLTAALVTFLLRAVGA